MVAGGDGGDELSVIELYKRTSQEVDSLKARLGTYVISYEGSGGIYPTHLHRLGLEKNKSSLNSAQLAQQGAVFLDDLLNLLCACKQSFVHLICVKKASHLTFTLAHGMQLRDKSLLDGHELHRRSCGRR